MSPSKRPCIEVENRRHSPGPDAIPAYARDPVEDFVSIIREERGCTQDVYRANLMLLRSLINNCHIPKSSIIWDNDCIHKIHGVRLDRENRIVYERAQSKREDVIRDEPHTMSVNLLSLKEAVLREKRWNTMQH